MYHFATSFCRSKHYFCFLMPKTYNYFIIFQAETIGVVYFNESTYRKKYKKFYTCHGFNFKARRLI